MRTHIEGSSPNRVPLFDGTNYKFWRRKIKIYILSDGSDVSQSIVIGYTTPSIPPVDIARKKLSDNNAKAMNAVLGSLSYSKYVKSMHHDIEK